MIYIYDIECFKNYFGVTFKDVNTKQITNYVIYYSHQGNNKNDLEKLLQFIGSSKSNWFVGYNNKVFDNQLLNYIYSNDILRIMNEDNITQDIFEFMLSIINTEGTEYKYNLPFQSVDLMKVGNVQHKSLKLVAVNLNWPLIQDTPKNVNEYITDTDLEEIYKYNLNDVEITEALYYKLRKDINVRWEVGQKYGIDLMSEPDSGMANRLLEKMYSDVSGIPIKELREMRTERKIIHYENIIFPHIKFKSQVLKELLNEIKSQIWYKNQPYFNKTVIFNGIRYKLGIGGIHSDDKGGVFTNDKHKIIDCDIASMYPSLIINNNLYPAHLSKTFLLLYKKLIEQRIEAKNAGKETESYVLKILLNSVFGKTLYEHHWLYDPLVGLRVTINGQLYMLMLIEQLVLNGFEVISANTDGLVTLVPKHREEEYKQICEMWCVDTAFLLEYTEYDKYIRRDVNNYITIKSDGSTKEKGEFLQFDKLSLRQGIDKPIISKALYNYFVHNIPIQGTIYDEKNIYSFCIAKRVDNKFVNEFHTLENGLHKIEELQRSVRFYISTNGGALYKVDRQNNKYINYCVNKKITILNDNINKDIKEYNIDYGYYIKETQKIIDEIIDPQLSLF